MCCQKLNENGAALCLQLIITNLEYEHCKVQEISTGIFFLLFRGNDFQQYYQDKPYIEITIVVLY